MSGAYLSGEALARLLLATGVALLGGLLGVLFGGARRRLAPLVGVAGGALLAVTLVSLLPEAARSLATLPFLIATGSGYLAFFLVGRYVYPVCPACASSAEHHEHEHESGECASDSDHHCGCGDDHGGVGHAHGGPGDAARALGIRNTSLLLALVLTVHSMVDGLAVVGDGGAAGHAGHGHDAAHFGLAMLLAVGLHKLPEGLALSALLMSAGSRPLRAFLLTAAVEGTTLLGGVLGARFLHDAPPVVVGATLAHIGGGFLYLVCHGLFGGLLSRPEGGKLLPALPHRLGPQFVYGTLGFAAVALLLWAFG